MKKHPDGTPKLPESVCVRCGYRTDAATAPGGEKVTPREGDVSVCLKCCHVSAFDAGLNLRPLTDAEWSAFDPEILEQIARIRAAQRCVIPRPQSYGPRIERTEKR